jgi:hypothetical protein
VFVCTPSLSVSLGDIAGTWDTYSEAKLKISGVGSFLDENPSTTTLGLDRTFSLFETTSTGPYNYTGAFDLIDENKLSFAPDTNGENELISTWVDWAEEIAFENGVAVTDISFYDINITISRPSISKRTLIPKKTKITAKGRVSAWIDGEFFDKKFSYTSKVSFIGRLDSPYKNILHRVDDRILPGRSKLSGMVRYL